MRLRELALSLAVLLAIPPSLAHAQSAPGKEHAKKLFDEGVALEKKNDYAGALARYKEAESIAVTAGLRFHKGYCLEMLGKLNSALEEYEAAEKLANEQGKTEVRAAVVARLEPMRGRVPQMSIRFTSPIKDGEVQVDGAPVGAPLLDGKSFRIDPGDHVVTAKAPGYKSWKRDVHVVEAITTTVDISMDREAGGAAVPPPVVAPVPAGSSAPASSPATSITEPPREADRSRSVVVPILTTAGAVTLVVTGVVFFAVAGGAKSDADKECPLKVDCDSEKSTVRTFDTLALGSFIGAAGLGVLSVVLWTKTGSSSSANAPAARFVATPGGAGIAGAF